jgi:hypothetical protein
MDGGYSVEGRGNLTVLSVARGDDSFPRVPSTFLLCSIGPSVASRHRPRVLLQVELDGPTAREHSQSFALGLSSSHGSSNHSPLVM